MNMSNPILSDKIEFRIDFLDYPDEKDKDWDSCKLSEFNDDKRKEWEVPMPLPEGDTWPLYNLCAGKYGLDQGSITLGHARQHEIFEDHEQYASMDEVYDAMRSMPQDLRLFRRQLPPGVVPNGWDNDKYGFFCLDGAQIFAIMLPSTNWSNTDKWVITL